MCVFNSLVLHMLRSTISGLLLKPWWYNWLTKQVSSHLDGPQNILESSTTCMGGSVLARQVYVRKTVDAKNLAVQSIMLSSGGSCKQAG